LVEWLDQGKIIICDFNQKYLSPSTAKRLSNLFLGYLAGEIIKREAGQRASRWRLIVDEAHELATLPFAQMVTQMRTYNAFPVIASQSRTQMERNPELLAAADLTSAQFELMLAERDVANLRWTRSEEELAAARTREQFTAHYRLTKRPKDTDFEGVLALRPWHGEEFPGQLEQLRQAGIELATPKAQLRDLYAFRAYAELRETMDDDDQQPKQTQAGPPGTVASQARAGKTGATRGNQRGRGDAGTARSNRVSDRDPDRPPVLHRPYSGGAQTGEGAGPIDASGQSEPATAQGSRVGGAGAHLHPAEAGEDADD
jgi:hypothetical protein